MKKVAITLLIIIPVILIISSQTQAYKTDTHWLITQQAVLKSNNYTSFINEFNIEGGSAFSMIGLGAVREDDSALPVPRYFHHFYDPINEQGWLGYSNALIWGYRYESALDKNDFSWSKARKYMFDSLTAENKNSRAENSNLMFRSLGQIIHLVEDMAQPSHTRNDAHASHSEDPTGVTPAVFNPSHMEDWAQGHGGEVITFANSATGPRSVDFFDDAFETLALFSNQNFFSDDTIFKDYEVPSKEQTNYTDAFLPAGTGMAADVVAEDGQIYKVPYIIKTQGVYTGYKLAHVGYFGPVLVRSADVGKHLLAFQIDDEVAKENAQLLIPQAVGYSAGLLNYFFRGNMEARFDGTGIKITNKSTEAMNGTFALYYDATDGKRYPIEGASWPLSLTPGQTSTPQSLTGPLNPPPQDPGKYLLVFRGTLGAESDAVVAKGFQVHYVFIIQESAELKSVPIEEQHISGPGHDQIKEDKHWKGCPQTVTGRFVVYGSIQRISLVPTTYEGLDQLFINGEPVDNNTWVADSGADKPTSWQVERSCIDPEAYPPMQLEVKLANGDIFIQYLVVYNYAYESVGYEPAGALGSLYPYTQFRSSSIELSTYFDFATALIPGLGELKGTEQFELIQLNHHTPDETFEGIIGGRLYILSVSLTLLDSGRRYYYEYSSEGSSVGTFPDPYVVTLTGQLNRIYSEKELDSLKAMGIHPEDYSIILQ